MKQSVDVTQEQISEALQLLGISLQRRLIEKGRESFVNATEAFGDAVIKMGELEHAVHIKESQRIIDAFLDVAVGCVHGVASLKAMARAQEKKQGEKP